MRAWNLLNANHVRSRLDFETGFEDMSKWYTNNFDHFHAPIVKLSSRQKHTWQHIASLYIPKNVITASYNYEALELFLVDTFAEVGPYPMP